MALSVCLSVCVCVSGVITGCRLPTTSLVISQSPPISGSRCTVSTMNTVSGLTSATTTRIAYYLYQLAFNQLSSLYSSGMLNPTILYYLCIACYLCQLAFNQLSSLYSSRTLNPTILYYLCSRKHNLGCCDKRLLENRCNGTSVIY